MGRLMMVVAVLAGLSACHGGISGGVGDSGQRPTHAATDAWQSAVAQASIGSSTDTVLAAAQ